MFFKSVSLVLVISLASAAAQFSSAFFGAAFPSGFVHPFSDFGASTAQFPSDGGARSMTGPILFPPAPESRDTSGVVIGASGYGFVPPGGKGVGQGRGLPPPPPPPPASAAFTSSFGPSPFAQSFFHL